MPRPKMNATLSTYRVTNERRERQGQVNLCSCDALRYESVFAWCHKLPVQLNQFCANHLRFPMDESLTELDLYEDQRETLIHPHSEKTMEQSTEILRAKDGRIVLQSAILELCREFESENPDFMVTGMYQEHEYQTKVMKSVTVTLTVKE